MDLNMDSAGTFPPEELLEDGNSIVFSGLDPILGSLGEMVGLLDGTPDTKDTYELNNQWFTDPIENTKSGFTKNSSQLSDLLGQILGKVGGNALGIPVQDPALLGTWYPVKYNEEPTGLYFVTYPKGDETVIGMGVLHTWKVPSEKPLLKVNVWGMIPFLRVGNGEVNITFNKVGYPINFGIAVENADDKKPLVAINDVSFKGVKVNAAIDLASADPFQIAILVLKLKLPGDPVPTDRTLADLEAITGKQILETASSLFVGALSKVFDDEKQQTRISYLPPLLGFTSIVPKSDKKLPVLEWYELFNIAAHPADYPNGVATPFLNWFNTLASDTTQLKTWLSCLGGFISGAPTDATGTGSRIDPFLVSIVSLNTIGKLNFTIGTEVLDGGIRYFYPGISFSGDQLPISTSDIALSMKADLELARFQLSGVNVGAEPTVNFQFKLLLANKTADLPLCSFDNYRFGNLEGGLAFGLSGALVPYFLLNKVVTPSSSFDSINLLSPSQLADAGASVLSDGIKTLLGLASNSNTFSTSVATLIGLSTPSGAGKNWPASLPAPFDAEQMIHSISDPLHAWAKYYLETLRFSPLVDGKTAFTYIVQDFGQLLNSVTGSETLVVTGNGTPDSPWQARIALAKVSLPAYFTAYQQILSNGDTLLMIGLNLEPELALRDIKVVPSLRLDVASIVFPSAANPSQGVTADWLPLVSAKLTLPNGFDTPQLGGVSVHVKQSQLSASWNRYSGWGWSLLVNEPSLLIDGKKLELGQNLNFNNQTSLEDLVKTGVATFGPFLTGALGVFLMRTETRAGLLVTGAFGLLTDLSKSPIFPEGFTWNGFSQLNITSFTQPWPQIRQQIASDFSSTEKAKSLLGLLSWTILTDLVKPPEITGKGTFDEPYSAPLPNGFALPVWYNATGQSLGVGLARTDTYQYERSVAAIAVKFQFTLESRLNAVEYSLETGTFVASEHWPSFSFLGTLSNPDGLLIDLPLQAGKVNRALLGFTLKLSGGKVKFEPIVTLVGVTLAGQEEQASITLQQLLGPDFSATLQSSFYTVLNAAIQAAIDQVQDVAGFKTAYSLLELLGLTTPWDESATPKGGINVPGWTGLLANFDTYMETQLSALLTDKHAREKLFTFLEDTFDVHLPSFPEPLLDLFASLQICGPAEEGYPLYPQALLDVVSNPVVSLKARFERLFADPILLKKLTKELTRNIGPAEYGKFTFGSNSDGVITLEVKPGDAFTIGTFLRVSGSLQLDLVNEKLTLTLNPYCPILGLTLRNELLLTFPLKPEDLLRTSLVWGDGDLPSAEPLPLYPFVSEEFVDKLSKVAPAYVLNILSNAVLEDGLLKKYPLVQKVFEMLGIAAKTATSRETGLLLSGAEQWSMPSILGILSDPLGWLLSDSVLGLDGRFNVGKFAELLKNLPEVSSDNGIALKPLANGVAISGLPYELGIDITGTSGIANFDFHTTSISIAGGKGKLDNLQLGIALDRDYQPSFTGLVDLSSTAIPIPIFATVGYNKGFLLKVAQGTPARPSGLTLQLLPFLGWGNLAGEAAALAATTLLNTVMPKLIDGLSKTAAGPFIGQMVTFGKAVKVDELIAILNEVLTPKNFREKTQSEIFSLLEQKSLDWLKQRFSPAEAPVTALAVKTMLADVLKLQLTTDGGLIKYQPSIDLPLVISAGLNPGKLLGLWADLRLPTVGIIDIHVAQAGAGVNIDTGALDFTFGVDLTVPVEGTTGPSISLAADPNKFFTLKFDPIADVTRPGNHSQLTRELLPDFFPKQTGEADALSQRMADWIFSVFKIVIPRYISALVLNESSVKAWLEAPIIGDNDKAPSPALLLEASSLIISEGKQSKSYYLNTIDNLLKITPEVFFGNFLKTLMQNELTLWRFGEGKKSTIKIGPELNHEGSYGLHLFAPNLKIPSIPNLVLQLGDADNNWITETGGVTGDPGIGVYLPISFSKDNELSADFSRINVVMNNVGFDMVGTKGAPLVNLSRFVIGAIKPRILFDLQLNGGDPKVALGAAVTLQDIGISLAPNQLAPKGGNSTNPIASNLLGSGDAQSGNNPPTNPTFSVTTAYSKKLYVNLKSDTGNGSEVILPVQRAFGPLFVDSLGLGWENQTKVLDFLFSGSVELAGLKTTLIGLTVGIPTETPADFDAYTLDLQGLDISFKGGSVTLDAGLLKQTDPYLCYNGTAVVKGGSFSLLALGSYAEVASSEEEGAPKVPSLFVFGVLNIPLGGPPAFFITGIAAGFSFNRGLIIPAIDKVQDFPLVKGVVQGTFTSNDPVQALKDLSQYVNPQVGQYWLAAGIKFKSFELITTAALLFLSFGRDWEVNLLGVSYATLPPEIPPSSALAYFELAIKVSFKPTLGIISAEAQLTPNSYVLTKDCKITGGFAFFLWYKDIVGDGYTIHAGDFVISLGGYHPAFAKPVYYPEVPRLGMQWKMEVSVGKISIAGGAYFALCPTAIMAGGYLNVNYSLGPLSAWLNAYANFLIEWKPFYFNVGIGITVGVSFGVTIFGVSITLKAQLGAKLLLEGPPTHGYINVNWYVISFTIPIGEGKNATVNNNLTWDEFEKSFLPPTPKEKNAASAFRLASNDSGRSDQVVKWAAQNGMQSTNESDALWIVNPVPFAVSVQSAIPASEVTVASTTYKVAGVGVGVRPMGYNTDLKSPFTITVSDKSGKAIDLVARKISLTPITNGAPAALWSKQLLVKTQAPDPSTMLIPGALFGLTLNADRYVITGNVPAFNLQNLKYDRNSIKQLPFANVPKYPAAARYLDQRAYTLIRQTIMNESIIRKRNETLLALQASAILAPLSPDLSVMAFSPELILQDLPVMAKIGIYQNGGVPEAGRAMAVSSTKRMVASSAPLLATATDPRLQGIFKKYVRRTPPAITEGEKSFRGLTSSAGPEKLRARWIDKSAAGAGQRQLLRSAIPPPEFITLHDGGVAIWKIDPGHETVLQNEGSLPVIIFSFDRYSALIEMKFFEPDTEYTLPAGTAQVAVQGYEDGQDQNTGWKNDTLLLKINPVWALADGALIRVQNSQRIAIQGTGKQMGMIEADRLLSHNYVQGSTGLEPGWIQTLFSSAAQYVAVLVKGSDHASDAIGVTILAGAVPTRPGAEEPIQLRPYQGDTIFAYTTPEAGVLESYYGVMVKPNEPDVKILGVYVLSTVEQLSRESVGMPLLALRDRGLDLEAPAPPTSRISLTLNPTR